MREQLDFYFFLAASPLVRPAQQNRHATQAIFSLNEVLIGPSRLNWKGMSDCLKRPRGDGEHCVTPARSERLQGRLYCFPPKSLRGVLLF